MNKLDQLQKDVADAKEKVMNDKELIEEALRFYMRLEHYNTAFGNDKEIIQRLVERIEELKSDLRGISESNCFGEVAKILRRCGIN